MLCVITLLLLFLGLLNPIEQVSEIIYQYFRNCLDKFLNFARWDSLDTLVLDGYNLSALSVIHSNTCLSYLQLSGENTVYTLTVPTTHCSLSSPVTSCLSLLSLTANTCRILFMPIRWNPFCTLPFFSFLLPIYTILSSSYYATFFLHLVLCFLFVILSVFDTSFTCLPLSFLNSWRLSRPALICLVEVLPLSFHFCPNCLCFKTQASLFIRNKIIHFLLCLKKKPWLWLLLNLQAGWKTNISGYSHSF